MKQSIFVMVVFLFFTIGLHAQNQFSLNIDSIKTGLLGFNKHNLPLTLKNSTENLDLKFRKLSEIKIDEKYSEWNMPIHEPQGHHLMFVQVPDSTIGYSMIIVNPETN